MARSRTLFVRREWIRSLDVSVGPEVAVLGFGGGHEIDMAACLRKCASIIFSAPDFRSAST